MEIRVEVSFTGVLSNPMTFPAAFLSFSLVRLICIKHDCFITFPNTEKGVENMTRSEIFLTKFEVFGNNVAKFDKPIALTHFSVCFD